jgi:hypothetical protein
MNTTEFRTALAAAFAARKSYEAEKNSENATIQLTLDKLAKAADHEVLAEFFLANSVSPDFINRTERSTARFNVYAAEKVVNVGRALASAGALNHYTRAVLASAKALEGAEFTLTHKDAVAACSLDVRHTEAKREAILKHTRYQKHTSPSTASTQASSSINALQLWGVLVESRDAAGTATYKIAPTSAAAAALLAALQ